MTAPARFKQSDVTRALKAALAAGMVPKGFKVDALGAIVISFGNDAPANSDNPWDDEFNG